jgi:glycosyltransferase involved in cell wall biosynthesis
MRVCVALEHRFVGTPDGRVWTPTHHPYGFFSNYLQVFDRVRVLARVFPAGKEQRELHPADGPGVEFYAMPPYAGPFQFAWNRLRVKARASGAVEQGDAAILRVPGQVANSVEYWLRKRGMPFALEVVGDPYDNLSPRANRHPVAPMARRYFTRHLRSQCQRANAVSYVTQFALQRRYPPGERHYTTEYSSVALRDDSFIQQRSYATAVSDVNLTPDAYGTERTATPPKGIFRCLCVGMLDSLVKGPDTLIDAIAICNHRGLSIHVVFVGAGPCIEKLRKRTIQLGIEEFVEFRGGLPSGEPVRHEIDSADIFVLPSRAEGLPRAMLEAMARGVPCIGSTVGGIPELLPEQDLVPPDAPIALADKLMEVLRDPDRLARMSERSLAVAKEYYAPVLDEKRRQFYRVVSQLTKVHYSHHFAGEQACLSS